MAHAAAAESTATFRFGNLCEFMGLSLLGCKMAIQTSGMTRVADSLLVDRLLLRKWNIKVLTNSFRISIIKTGGLEYFLRRKVGKRRAAVVRAVRIHPGSHGPLAEIGAHQGGPKLFELLLMAPGFGTGFLGQFRVEIIGFRVPVAP